MPAAKTKSKSKTKTPEVHPLRDKLIEAIADFVIIDEARKSIELEMGKPDAKSWALIRNYANIRGWGAAKDEVVAALNHILGIKE